MATANDVLFEDDFSGASTVLSGEPIKHSGPFKILVGTPDLGESSNGNPRVNLPFEVLEDPSGRGQEGCTFRTGQNVPAGEPKTKRFQQGLWLNILESMGHDVKQLKKKFKLTLGMIENKTAYIIFKTKEDAGGEYAKADFITRKQYEKYAERIRAKAAAGELDMGADTEEETPADVELPTTTAVSTETSEGDLLGL
jgi:hypothetical protein